MRLSGWRNVIFEDGILRANQFVTWQPKWTRDLQHSTFALTELDRQSTRPDLIDLLVMSSPGTHVIAPREFFKLLLWHAYIYTYWGVRIYVYIDKLTDRNRG